MQKSMKTGAVWGLASKFVAVTAVIVLALSLAPWSIAVADDADQAQVMQADVTDTTLDNDDVVGRDDADAGEGLQGQGESTALDDDDAPAVSDSPNDDGSTPPLGETGLMTAAAGDLQTGESLTTAAGEPTTINIGTYDELYQAFERVSDNPGEYIFNLTADVEIYRGTDGKTNTVYSGSTVTIYGNGHKLWGRYYGLAAKGGTLNLGTADGGHGTLTIQINDSSGQHQVYYPALYTSTYDGGTINMYDGVTVTGKTNTLGLSGTAVCVDGGTFNMYGGSIAGCNNLYSGGAVALRGASAVFNMYGGEISNNKSTSTTNANRRAGAGVMIDNGTFNMQGGTISGNKANIGAGVYINPSGAFNFSGGTVTGNVAETNGGGIYNAGGKLNISGTASITGNTANSNSGYGGGIYAFGYNNAAGTVTISGGSITSNTAAYGAGIWNRSYSTVNMTGGTISQNSGGFGGGVGNVGTYNMSGGIITQNTASVDGGGVYTNMNIGGGTGGDGVFKMTGGTLHNNTAVDGADIAAQVTDSDHLQLVDAAGMNATLSRSGQAITGWYEDGKYTSSGQKVSNSNWSNTEPTHYVDHSTDYNTTTDWYGALYLIAAHGSSDTATVAFKIVGGTWTDGGSADKTVTLGSDSSMKLASAQIPSGKAKTGYGSGTWSVSATSGTAPTSAEPNTTHTFVVGDNIVYTLTFTPNQHKVTYVYDGDVPADADAVPSESTRAYGEEVDVENLPTLDGYRFSGWTTTDVAIRSKTANGLLGAGVSSNQVFTMPDKDVTLHGQWVKQSTITFDTDGGSVIDPITGDVGSSVTPPADPTKDGYDFAGWEPSIPGTIPNDDLTVKAKWTPKGYTITFVNYDGTELQSGQVPYDTMPAYSGSTPTKPADAQYAYTFAGWTPTIEKVTGNKTYTATFTPTLRAYTVTWVGDNGVELEKDANVPYGTTPSYDGAIPTKAADAEYTYAFAGWTPAVTLVTGDITYRATYTKTPIAPPVDTHTVSFDASGGSPVDSQTIENGKPAAKPADPTRDGYTFKGWQLDDADYDFSTPVTGDITLVAKWEAAPESGPAPSDGGEAAPAGGEAAGPAAGSTATTVASTRTAGEPAKDAAPAGKPGTPKTGDMPVRVMLALAVLAAAAGGVLGVAGWRRRREAEEAPAAGER